MVAGTGADEQIGLWPLAHGIERPAQFVTSHRRKVFPFQVDLRVVAFGQVRVSQQRGRRKHIPHCGFGILGGFGEISHLS